ncbi:hypothetical protein [Candidatus Binatus soli]|jgi:hypothetical protein|uniref:hypothetical protein n=1 Tax=Candidatus Binatus soli TaxID=1953413 RepID=UPI003D0A853F
MAAVFNSVRERFDHEIQVGIVVLHRAAGAPVVAEQLGAAQPSALWRLPRLRVLVDNLGKLLRV